MKSLVILIALTISSSLLANDAKWVCMKDGKQVEVKGESAEKKKAACDTAKGMWVEEVAKQSAGKSAGW